MSSGKRSNSRKRKRSNQNYFHFGEWGMTSLDFIFCSDAWINIAYGSVRSGKTIACNARWIEFVDQSDSDEFLISGKTSQSLKRNVIKPLIAMLNTDGYQHQYRQHDGELIIEDKTCYVMGFNDEKAVDVIAGMSVGGWYADEIARCPQSAVEMAISRCSDIGAKMFWNTNPDSPYHYLFTNYINNHDLLSRISTLTRLIKQVFVKYYEIISPFRNDFNHLKKNEYPLPIGLFSSMILGNIYLKSFDDKIRNHKDIIYYGRYVDDILVVANKTLINPNMNNQDIISELFVNQNILAGQKQKCNLNISKVFMKNMLVYFSKNFEIPYEEE